MFWSRTGPMTQGGTELADQPPPMSATADCGCTRPSPGNASTRLSLARHSWACHAVFHGCRTLSVNSVTVIHLAFANHSENPVAGIDVINNSFGVVTPRAARSARKDAGVGMTTQQTRAIVGEAITDET